MLMELGYASSTTTAAVDIFHSRGTYPWPPKYGTNESGSLAIALEWLAPLCAREKPWTIGKDSPLDNEGESHCPHCRCHCPLAKLPSAQVLSVCCSTGSRRRRSLPTARGT